MALAELDHSVCQTNHVALRLGMIDRNPIEVHFCRAPRRAMPQGIATSCKPMAQRRYRRIVKAKLSGTACSQIRQANRAEPPTCFLARASLPPPFALALNLAKIVPDVVDRARLLTKRSARRGRAVFHSIAVGKDHGGGNVICTSEETTNA